MIEILLEDILNKIHQKSFNAPKQLSEELGRLIIRGELTQEQYSYCSSKIFNSDVNLFAFVNSNCHERDKSECNLRKEILEVISDYIHVNKKYLINYLSFIRDSALTIFKKDISHVVKESALKIIVVLLQSYDPSILESVIRVGDITNMLLDEIKMLKPAPSVKGRIWQILGELIKKFPKQLEEFRLEIQEVSFYAIKMMMEEARNVEIKVLKGLLQLTRAMLEVETYSQGESKIGFIK